MPNRPTTLIEEMVSAARGVFDILRNRRAAAQSFDFGRRGLAGSYIAFLIASTVSAFLPDFSGDSSYTALPPTRLLTVALFLYAIQVGFSSLALRQMKRLDGFVPYLVATNWASFFLTAISSALALVGLSSDIVVSVIAIIVLVVEINIARLIVTLSGWQVAIFLVAQFVGISVGFLLIGLLFPNYMAQLAAAGG